MKKGFFFSIDSILALMLFGIVLTGIYSFFLTTHSIDQQFDLTKYPEVQRMISDGTIKNTENTLLEQIVIFRENEGGVSPSARVFVEDISDGLIPEQYGFSVDVNGEIFKKSKEVSTLVSRERIVFG